MKQLSIHLNLKPVIARLHNGELVEVLTDAPKPASVYPADKWVMIRMPDGNKRIIQRAVLLLASKPAH
ncbi:MAG: hypothetical protein KDI44_02460 [Thiothrix sp.]|nr:hypothetical protein [Thiothrix sp.]